MLGLLVLGGGVGEQARDAVQRVLEPGGRALPLIEQVVELPGGLTLPAGPDARDLALQPAELLLDLLEPDETLPESRVSSSAVTLIMTV